MNRDLNQELKNWDGWPDAWKPTAGDVLVGTVESYDTGFTPYGSVRTVIIVKDNGERVSLWLSSTEAAICLTVSSRNPVNGLD